MKRSGFQFKQFFIEHSACAMKVGTDSILLGSWIKLNQTEQSILDIGTGSGLLAIMLAQKTNRNCPIVGIDIDVQAIEQAKVNTALCPWGAQLKFERVGLQSFQTKHPFDLIVTNPPYFTENHRANVNEAKASRIQARQTTELSHLDLLQHVARLLAEKGTFYCVLPHDNIDKFIQQAKFVGLFCCKQLQIRSNPKAEVIRSLLAFVKTETTPAIAELVIYQAGQQYTPAYRQLCKDYYQNF